MDKIERGDGLRRLPFVFFNRVFYTCSYPKERKWAFARVHQDRAFRDPFFHDQIPNARHKLPDNSSLSLQRRRFGQTDRTWSQREFNLFVAKAMELGREDYAALFCLARYAALRLHECFRIDTAMAEKAVRTGVITVKGKGGLVRDVPINLSIEIELKKMLVATPRGHKLFVASGDKTHLAMHRLESFIDEYRDNI